MRTFYLSGWMAVIVVASGLNIAKALPQAQQVAFQIHETPGDPSTPIQFSVTLRITATDSKDGSVAWQVTEARFAEAGSASRVWIMTNPPIGTVDGLWWVQHQDVNSPIEADFRMPPSFEGVAEPLTGTTESLVYSFNGPAQPPPTTSSRTTTATYSFQTQIGNEIIVTSDDEE